jgi:hypothetical protein
MQEVKKTRKKMLQEEQDTTDILEDLTRQGYTEDRDIKAKLKIMKFRIQIAGMQAEKDRKKKTGIKQAGEEFSIHLSQLTSLNSLDFADEDDLKIIDPEKDLIGVENNLPKRLTLNERRNHIIQARGAL